jgi:hypothetical protein
VWQNRDSDSGTKQIDVFIGGLVETQPMEQLSILGITRLSHLVPQDDDSIQGLPDIVSSSCLHIVDIEISRGDYRELQKVAHEDDINQSMYSVGSGRVYTPGPIRPASSQSSNSLRPI